MYYLRSCAVKLHSIKNAGCGRDGFIPMQVAYDNTHHRVTWETWYDILNPVIAATDSVIDWAQMQADRARVSLGPNPWY